MSIRAAIVLALSVGFAAGGLASVAVVWAFYLLGGC